jgi:hypothetical protein
VSCVVYIHAERFSFKLKQSRSTTTSRMYNATSWANNVQQAEERRSWLVGQHHMRSVRIDLSPARTRARGRSRCALAIHTRTLFSPPSSTQKLSDCLFNVLGACFSALGTAASYRVSIQFRKDFFIPSQVCLPDRRSQVMM